MASRRFHPDGEGRVLEDSVDSNKAYWEEKQKGYDWDGKGKCEESSRLSNSMRKNDSMNQYNLIKHDGLNEIAENMASAEDAFCQPALHLGDSAHIQDVAKNSNPLQFSLKGNLAKRKLSAAQTINNMILGQDYFLIPFKGKEEKIELLKAAVESHDGNAILVVIMFLKNTLKKSIFQREIRKFLDAVNVYLSYLHEDHEIDELSNMLLLLDMPEDAAIFKYDSVVSVQLPERKIKLLENCLNTHFQPDSVTNFLRESVLEHKLCIADQIVLEDHRISSEVNLDEASKLFEILTGRKELVDSSALCSLVFCCLYFYNVAPIALIGPSLAKVRYKLSPKQFTWCALRTLAMAQKWTEIEDLFFTKNWLGGTKMRSCIGFEKILDILFKMKAPPEVIKKYVSCLENQEVKLFFAKKYQCHSIVVEILKKNRDRQGLIEYKESLPPHSIEFCTAASILNQADMNWRN